MNVCVPVLTLRGIGFPAPDAWAPFGGEHLASFDGQYGDEGFFGWQAAANHIFHHPVTVSEIEDCDVGLTAYHETPRRWSWAMALAGLEVHMVTTWSKVKPRARKRVIISTML